MKICILLIASTFLVSCNTEKASSSDQKGTDKGPSRPVSSTAEVRLDSDKFSAPDNLQAGYVTIKYKNNTDEMHSAHLIKLDEGYTTAQLIQAYKESSLSNSPRPNWMTHIGGVISEPGSSEVTLRLEPGNYTWVCVMGSDSLPHFEGLENQPLMVTGQIDNSFLSEPADINVDMTDQSHQVKGNIRPGKQSIHVKNTGSQYHLLAISKLNEGATPEDLMKWYLSYQGPPPATNIIATSAIGPGLTARIESTFDEGDYVFYCMANAEGKFHLFEGAITMIRIEN